MDNSSIGSDNSQQIISLEQLLTTPFGTTTTKTTTENSTISPSVQTVSVPPAPDSTTPSLIPPVVSREDYLTLLKVEFGEIASKIGEAWSKSEAQIAAEIKQIINSPNYLSLGEEAHKRAEGLSSSSSDKYSVQNIGISNSFSPSKSEGTFLLLGAQSVVGVSNTPASTPTQPVNPTVGVQPAAHANTVGAAQKGADEGTTIGQLAAQGFVPSIGELAFFHSKAANVGTSDSSSSSNPISTVVQGASKAVFSKEASTTTEAASGAAGALFVVTAYRVAVERVPKPIDSQDVTHDVNFAKTNAERILGSVSSPNFASFIQRAISLKST